MLSLHAGSISGKAAATSTRSCSACRSNLSVNRRGVDAISFNASKRPIVRLLATTNGGELTLLKTEEQAGGTVLFVFGTEAEKAAAQSQESAPPKAEPEVEPEANTSSESRTTIEATAEDTEAVSPTVSGAEAEQSAGAATAAQEPTPVQENGGQSFTSESLASHKVHDLREICKQKQLKGYSKLKKEELIELIVGQASA